MAGTGTSFSKRLCTPPSSATERRSKRRMSDYMDVEVRRGRRSMSSAGQFRQHDVAEIGVPGAMVFRIFLPKQKEARSRSERNRF